MALASLIVQIVLWFYNKKFSGSNLKLKDPSLKRRNTRKIRYEPIVDKVREPEVTGLFSHAEVI